MKYDKADSAKVSSNPAEVPRCTVIYDALQLKDIKAGVCEDSSENHFKLKKKSSSACQVED